MRRGEVWWGDLPAPVGRRPFVVLSTDVLNDVRDVIIVAPVTTRARDVWTHVPIGEAEGLNRGSTMDLGTLLSVRKADVHRYAGKLSDEKMQHVESMLARLFDLGGHAALRT